MSEVTLEKIQTLRTLITENLRIQQNTNAVNFVDSGSLLSDLATKQNHVVFARRGCGKTLLLKKSSEAAKKSGISTIYLNCEDFKRHSFPNVLLEVLQEVFRELRRQNAGWTWRRWRARNAIDKIIWQLEEIKRRPDERREVVKEARSQVDEKAASGSVKASGKFVDLGLSETARAATTSSIERAYERHYEKLEELNRELPDYKSKIRDYVPVENASGGVFIQLDDLYHLNRVHQAFIVDYVHRLCKDLPFYFKIATLRHVSTLYVDANGQPFGAQERHDFQPVNIDYDFSDFSQTGKRNEQILSGFGEKADLSEKDLRALFKGEGFNRLVMSGGGVPRDVMSLFLEILPRATDGRIGKDDVRISSRSNFERRIEELKNDSQEAEQEGLIRGIYLIRSFCLDRKSNIFGVLEESIQKSEQLRALLYRLLDYRIIHNCGQALTHKSQAGTFQAFAIDIGCYAHLRKLEGRFNEIDVSETGAKERMRSCPMLSEEWLRDNFPKKAASALEAEMMEDEVG